MNWKASLIRLARDRKGATAVEYGLIIALIILVIMATLIALGTTTSGMWNNVSSKVSSATGN